MKDEQQMRYYPQQQPQPKPQSNTTVTLIAVFGLIFSLINLGLTAFILYLVYELWEFWVW